MTYPLAIFAPLIGAPSETFIQRHMADLLPGKTVVVAMTSSPPFAGQWSVNGPALVLDRLPRPRLRQQLICAIPQKLGWQLLPDDATHVRRFLQKSGVRVILGEYLDFSLPWLSLAKELGIQFFGHAHGYDVSSSLRLPKWQKEYLRYNESSGVITMNNVSRKRLISLGLEPNKVHVVPCGVDVLDEPLRRETHELVRCLAVGRMVAKKGPILTLDAFRRAADICPGLRLDYIGGGELLAAARQFICAFKLTNKVTLHGVQSSDTVRKMMSEADIFLQHSMVDCDTGDEEGLPVAILEAMASGLPVVSTRHAGIPEAVQDGGITGFLVEEGDSADMGAHIITLANDSLLRRRLGEAARDRARRYFSWDQERVNLLGILGL